MYKIRTSAGEETTYANQDEFAEAVQEGKIGPDALIYHATTERWILVCLNPDYKQARNPLRPIESLEAPRSGGDETPFWQRTPPAGKPSAAELAEPPLLQHRLLRWGAVGAGVIILSGVGATIWWQRAGSEPVDPPMAIASESVGAAKDSATATIAMAAPTDSTSLWTKSVAHAPPPQPSASSLRGLSFGDAMSGLASKMNDDLRSIGFSGLFAPARLTAPEQLRAGRRSLQSAGNIVEYYRVESRRLTEEYGGGDSRSSLLPETYAMEQVADSLMGQMDRLLVFLLERQGSYAADRRMIDFDNPDDALEYRALCARLNRLRAAEAAARRTSHRAPAPPTRALLEALDSLPQLTAR